MNDENPTVSASKAEVSRIFLKKKTRWDNGLDTVPVDLKEDSPVRKAFTEAVHGRPLSAISSFWRRAIFSGRDVPPVVANSEADAIELVRSNPGGIGYVSSEVKLRDGVRILTLKPETRPRNQK